jgi:hypothetical protein
MLWDAKAVGVLSRGSEVEGKKVPVVDLVYTAEVWPWKEGKEAGC